VIFNEDKLKMKTDKLETIKQLLNRHGIKFEIIKGKLIADDEYSLNGLYCCEKRDLTHYSINDVKLWLGY
jgi:hypothetical protein